MGIVVFMSIASWLTFIKDNQRIAVASDESDILQVGTNRKIKFDYTDDNQGENLLIKTDKKNYYGISRTEVFFNVTNIGKKNEAVGLQFYFPQDNGLIEKIEQWKKGISHQVDIADFGPMDYSCKESWKKQAETNGSEGSMMYICPDTKERKACTELKDNEKICHIENEQTGTHKETKIKDDWVEISIQNKALPKKQALVDKLLFKSPPIKDVAQDFKVKKSTKGKGIKIKPGETEYFKMEISFSPHSSGEFYLEAIGDKGGYGLLDPWFDSGWQYRKSVTISGTTAGAQTNYVVPIVVNYGTGTDSGRSVYANSNCRTDFGDIRFTASDETTELDYYLDQKTDSDKALFWVEVGSIPASPSSATIYLYYGETNATTTSNGENTYQAFESFENSPTFDFDTAGGVDIALSSSSSYSPKDGSYVGINSGSQGYKKKHDNTTSFNSNYIAEGWVKTLSGGGTNENLGPGITIFGVSGNNNGYEAILDLRGSVSPQIREAWDYGTRTNGNYSASTDTWYFLDFRHSGTAAIARLYTEAQAYTGSAQTTTTKTDSTYTSGYYGIGTYNANHSVWDSFRVRKYASPEPLISVWGSEETQPGSLSVDIVNSSGTPVANPSVTFPTKNFYWSAQTSAATLGTASEKIRVSNTTGTATWTLEIAATSGATAVWNGGTYSYDFNDTAANGRLQVDASGATITPEGGCSSTGLSRGTATYFSQGSTDSITILSAGGTADTGCYWDFTGIDLTQDIPASQEADTYTIDMTLTVS